MVRVHQVDDFGEEDRRHQEHHDATTSDESTVIHGIIYTIALNTDLLFTTMTLIEKLLMGIVAFQVVIVLAWLTMVRKEMKEEKQKIH